MYYLLAGMLLSIHAATQIALILAQVATPTPCNPSQGGWPTPKLKASMSAHVVTYMQIMQTSHLWPL